MELYAGSNPPNLNILNGKMEINLDVDADEFSKGLADVLHYGHTDLQTIVRSLVTEDMARSLDAIVESGECIGYAFKNGGQSKILSVQSAIDRGGFDFWYLTVQVDMRPGIILNDEDVLPPQVMKWLSYQLWWWY